MINNELKMCCNDCLNIDIDTNTVEILQDFAIQSKEVTINCKHQCVCGKYAGVWVGVDLGKGFDFSSIGGFIQKNTNAVM